MRRLLVPFLLLLPLAAQAKKPPPPPEWGPSSLTEDDFRAGTIALNATKPEEAVTAFQAVLEREPTCGGALLGVGRALYLSGKAAEAEAPLELAATAFPDKLDAHIWYGRVLVELGKPAEGLFEAKAVLTIKPGSLDGQRVAQTALLVQKDYKQAHELLVAARAIANVVAYNCLEGVVYAEEGDAAKAAEMVPLCEGVPDPSLLDALKSRVTPAPAPAPAPAL